MSDNSHQNNKRKPEGRSLSNKNKDAPPIFKVYNANIKELAQKVKNHLGHSLFTIKVVNKNMTILKLTKVEDHSKVRDFLESAKLPYYTYTPRDMKPYSMMVKCFSETYDVNDLKNFLEEKQPETKVRKIIKLQHDRWIVQLEGESEAQSFARLQYLLNNKVQFERHKRKDIKLQNDLSLR